MSNRLMDLAWPLPIPPSPKVVLVALADQADDAGTCWPSIPSLCQRTSLGRTAVIEALKWLERSGAITVTRDGRCNRYSVTPDRIVSEPAGDFHYTYRITHAPSGLFYIGLRSAHVAPEKDDYWGSGKDCGWLSSVRHECSREILGTFPNRTEAAAAETAAVSAEIGDPKCLNRRASTPNQAKLSGQGIGPASEPSGRRTVRLADGDQSACRTDQSACRTTPVRLPDPNPQEPSITPKKATPKTRPPVTLPEWLPEEAWADWVAHRKATKHPMTPKAEELSIADLGRLREQGHDPVAVIHHAIKSGWRGLYAPPVRAGPNPGNHSAAANFRGKRYDATPDDKLPPGLR